MTLFRFFGIFRKQEDNYMNRFSITTIFIAAMTLMLSGCVIDDYDNANGDNPPVEPVDTRGAVRLSAEFAVKTSDIELPQAYNVIAGGNEYAVPNISDYLLPDLFEPGELRLISFNETEKLTRDGMLLKVEPAGNATRANDESNLRLIDNMPGYLFASGTNKTVPAGDTISVTLKMKQITFPIRIELPVVSGDGSLIEKIEGYLTGVAGIFDLSTVSVRKDESFAIPLNFSKSDSHSLFISSARLLGIINPGMILHIVLTYTDGTEQIIETDVSDLFKDIESEDFNGTIVIIGNLEAPEASGFSAVITDWNTIVDDVEIK